MEFSGSFGEWLKQRRQALDLTQKELAKRIGYSSIALRKIEAGERRPSKQVAGLLADTLRIPTGQQAEFLQFARGNLGAAPGEIPKASLSRFFALPIPRTSLIGREQEVLELCALLWRPDPRLVTLIGAPGVGKTRLALQVAENLRATDAVLSCFPDGIAFVELAPVPKPDLVVTTVARALGLHSASGMATPESIQAFLCEKTFLLIFDNFEHVLEAAIWVSILVSTCPHLKVMATSREPLHLYGEHEYLVAPLALPDLNLRRMPPDHVISEMVLGPAVQLFVQRAQTAKPGFGLSAQNILAVFDICARLDGLPLALELAAARIKFWTPEILLDALKHRLPFLVSQSRDLPDRHRTIYLAIDWSFQLLPAEEQSLFARLSVFSGSFTLEATTQLCSDSAFEGKTGPAATDHFAGRLSSLVDRNLLQTTTGTFTNRPRFVLLESVRAYAAEKLKESGEYVCWNARHARYFLNMVHEAELKLRGPDVAVWLNVLDEEIHNVRGAFSWSLDGGDIEAGLRALPHLLFYWQLRGTLEEARIWLERGLALEDEQPVDVRAALLLAAGAMDWFLGDNERSYQRCHAAMNLWMSSGNTLGMARTAFWLCLAAGHMGFWDEMEKTAWEGISLLRKLGEKWHLAYILWGWGDTLRSRNRLLEARPLLEESVRLYRELRDIWGLGYALFSLGHLDWVEGDYPQARPRFEEAFRLKRSITDHWGLAAYYKSMGQLELEAARATGNFGLAVELLEEGLRYYRYLGSRQFWTAPVVLLRLGQAAKYQGQYARAVNLIQEAFTLCQEWKLRLDHSALCLWDLAKLAELQGQQRIAAVYYGALAAAVQHDPKMLKPGERDELSKIQARLLQRQEHTGLTQAWKQGTGMSFEEILHCHFDNGSSA